MFGLIHWAVHINTFDEIEGSTGVIFVAVHEKQDVT